MSLVSAARRRSPRRGRPPRGSPGPSTPSAHLARVVEARVAVHGHLDLAVHAADHPQQHVVGVVVGRRAAVRVRAVLLVVPRADQEHVAHDDPAARRAPARLEDVGAGQVAARGRHLDVGRPEPEPAGVAVEDRPEHARRVEARQAEPLDVAVRATSAQVSQSDRKPYSAIGGNGLAVTPGRGPLRHRRAAAAGSSRASTLPSTSDPGARVRGPEKRAARPRPCLAGDEEDDPAARVHHRQRERDPRHQGRHPGRLDADHAPLALAERVVAGEQRADVRVGADPSRVRSSAAGPNSSSSFS